MTNSTLTAGSASKVDVETLKKPPSFSWNNIAIGAAIQVFEVSTLGQPFEVIKTHMAGKVNNFQGFINFFSVFISKILS